MWPESCALFSCPFIKPITPDSPLYQHSTAQCKTGDPSATRHAMTRASLAHEHVRCVEEYIQCCGRIQKNLALTIDWIDERLHEYCTAWSWFVKMWSLRLHRCVKHWRQLLAVIKPIPSSTFKSVSVFHAILYTVQTPWRSRIPSMVNLRFVWIFTLYSTVCTFPHMQRHTMSCVSDARAIVCRTWATASYTAQYCTDNAENLASWAFWTDTRRMHRILVRYFRPRKSIFFSRKNENRKSSKQTS